METIFPDWGVQTDPFSDLRSCLSSLIASLGGEARPLALLSSSFLVNSPRGRNRAHTAVRKGKRRGDSVGVVHVS